MKGDASIAEYLQVWQTKEVTIGLGFIDECVVLKRTKVNKKKRIRLRHECFSSFGSVCVTCTVNATYRTIGESKYSWNR